MRTTAFVFLLSFASLLVAGGPGYADPEPEAEAETRAFVAKTCVRCHPGPQLNTVVERRLERGPLADFLATHHVSDPAQRDAVSAYLERTARPGSEAPAD